VKTSIASPSQLHFKSLNNIASILLFPWHIFFFVYLQPLEWALMLHKSKKKKAVSLIYSCISLFNQHLISSNYSIHNWGNVLKFWINITICVAGQISLHQCTWISLWLRLYLINTKMDSFLCYQSCIIQTVSLSEFS
jgi:hypothetical protein